MAGFIKEKINFLFSLMLGLMLSSCANQLPPGGGAVDTVPPKIISSYPENGTTNFHDDYIELEFSKYIDKRTLADAFFISPSIEGELDFDWTGKSVRINFPNKLKKNITYIISIGTNLSDYNNHNRMAEAFTFAFSTGNEIDNGMITGKIFSDKPGGISIFAYLKGDSTINPSVKKPDYISQSGSDGNYKLPGLAPGDYRIYAVRDEQKSLLYQPEQDEIGIPFQDVKLTKSDTLFDGLNFFITKIDTVKPRLMSAVMTDANHILLSFSKDVDSSMIITSNFYLIDSTAKKIFSPKYVFKNSSKPANVILVINDKFKDKDEVYVFVKSIKDKAGNIFNSDFSSLTLSDRPDTTKPGIVNTVPPNNFANADFEEPGFSFYFNDAFDTAEAKTSISFSDDLGKFVLYNLRFLDDASFMISPSQNLETNTSYTIKIDLSKFTDLSGNKYDSTYQYKFKTINGLDFTGASGQLENVDDAKNPYLVLESSAQPKIIYSQHVKENKKFEFTRVKEGKYMLWCFYDADSSGTYSFGKAFPFQPSEKFSVYPDTLNLRPRWTVTNVKFKIK